VSPFERQLRLFDLDRDAPRAPAHPPRVARGTRDALPDLAAAFVDLNARFFRGRLEARVEWSNRLTASAGNCRPDQRLIRISAPYHRRRPDVLPVTLAHEMCHLVEPGHGAAFRQLGEPIARALGVGWHAFRYAEVWADLRRYRFLYRCARCTRETLSRKRLRASCGHCGPSRFDESYRLILSESKACPGPVLLGERPARVD
jgi:predicted SprT family Zn-dependent metalloprotease